VVDAESDTCTRTGENAELVVFCNNVMSKRNEAVRIASNVVAINVGGHPDLCCRDG
jgi:hypothetical protein